MADAKKEYQIGPLTMEHIFKATGMTNLSDLQAVMDQVEVALSKINTPLEELTTAFSSVGTGKQVKDALVNDQK